MWLKKFLLQIESRYPYFCYAVLIYDDDDDDDDDSAIYFCFIKTVVGILIIIIKL